MTTPDGHGDRGTNRPEVDQAPAPAPAPTPVPVPVPVLGQRQAHQRFTFERVRSGRAGNPVYRVGRPFKGFRRDVDGHLEATLDIERPTGRLGKLKRMLIGQPIHSELEIHERLTKRKALAVFSSDALSSVAYAPQETLIVLLGAGAAAAWWSLPIAFAVVALLAIVVTSYRQTIYTYPSGWWQLHRCQGQPG